MSETFRDLPKKLSYGLLALLVVYVVVRSVFTAEAKPLWYDELLTLAVTSLDSWSARLQALRLPLDGQPPLFYWIEHFALKLNNNPELALRLPSIAAFPVVLICVYVYARKQGSEAAAILCATALLLTDTFAVYAAEARPYSLVLACLAVALVSYQRLPSTGWTVLFGISLVLAESLHYLAVLSMIPFGLADLVLTWKKRRIRWSAWAAMVAGAVPLLLQWNLLSANRAYYGPHFWAHFGFTNLPKTYGEFLGLQAPFGGGVATWAVLAIATAYLWSRQGTPGQTPEDAAGGMLLLGFVLLPFFAYALVVLVMKSGLTPRYVLPTVLGMALTVGFVLSRARWKAIALSAAFLIATVGVQELSFWRSIQREIHETRFSGNELGRFIDSAGYRELPIAIPNYSVYLPLFHTVEPDLASRLVFLAASPSSPNVDLPTDTVNKGIKLLAGYWPVRMSYYEEFTNAHNKFLLYGVFGEGVIDWFTVRLAQDGWSMRIVRTDNYRMVYLVERK